MKHVMGESRRLAAIMAIVVVGYSRLIGDDEAGTARAVREHREAAQCNSISPRNDSCRPD
jgi:hypothetical protein